MSPIEVLITYAIYTTMKGWYNPVADVEIVLVPENEGTNRLRHIKKLREALDSVNKLLDSPSGTMGHVNGLRIMNEFTKAWFSQPAGVRRIILRNSDTLLMEWVKETLGEFFAEYRRYGATAVIMIRPSVMDIPADLPVRC